MLSKVIIGCLLCWSLSIVSTALCDPPKTQPRRAPGNRAGVPAQPEPPPSTGGASNLRVAPRRPAGQPGGQPAEEEQPNTGGGSNIRAMPRRTNGQGVNEEPANTGGASNIRILNPGSKARVPRPGALQYQPSENAFKPTDQAKKTAQALNTQATKLVSEGKYQDAVKLYQEAYTQHDAHPSIARNLAYANYKAGNYEAGLDVLDSLNTNPRMEGRPLQRFLELHDRMLRKADDPKALDYGVGRNQLVDNDGPLPAAPPNPAAPAINKPKANDYVEPNEAEVAVVAAPAGQPQPRYVAPPAVDKPEANGYFAPDAYDAPEPANLPPVLAAEASRAGQLARRARDQAQAGDHDAAAASACEAYRIDPDPAHMLEAGKNFMSAGRFQAALDCFAEVKANRSSLPELQATADSQTAQAGELLRQRLARDPTELMAAQAEASKVYSSAAKLWLDRTGYQPRVGTAFRAAACMEFSGDQERAAVAYRKVIELSGTDELRFQADAADVDAALSKSTSVSAMATKAKKQLAAMRLPEDSKFAHRCIPKRMFTGDTLQPEYSEEIEDQSVSLQNNVLNALTSHVRALAASGADPESFQRKVNEVRELFAKFTGDVPNVDAFIGEIAAASVGTVVARRGGVNSALTNDEVKTKFASVGIAVPNPDAANPGQPANPAATGPLTAAFLNRKVRYLKSTAERAPYEITTEPGQAGKVLQGNRPLDTSGMVTNHKGTSWAIYVMNPDGKIYVGNHQRGQFHHSSFLAGSEVAGAGEMRVENGTISAITNKSGHYAPKPVHLAQTIEQLSDMGINVGTIRVSVFGANTAGSVQELDWHGNAQTFLDTFRANKPEFSRWWKSQNYSADPFEGTPDEGKYW